MPFTEKFTVNIKLLPKPSKRRSGLMISKVRFIVAHDTGNPGSTAQQNVNYYINSAQDQSASAHLFVDDKQILECVPALTGNPEKAWHVLYNVPTDNALYGVNANDAAIGVEYCFGDNIDADKSYEKYVWVLAKLCYVYNLDPSKDIVGHFFLDPRRKTDPVTGLARSRRTYEQLLRDVLLEYNECTGKVPRAVLNALAASGTITTAVRLNVRSGPSTKSGVVETIPAGTVVNYDGIIEDGEAVNNNAKWYRSGDKYFWSGGFK